MKKLALSLIALSAAVGCQQMENPTPVLTRQQWKQVEANLLKTDPTPTVKVGAQFGNKIELIGFDVKQPLVAGQPTKIIWYWKALADIKENWKIFVHLDSKANTSVRQNLDHDPMGGLFVTSRWKKGMIIKDVQELTIRENYPSGKATPYVGLWKGNSRMPITNDVNKDKANRVVAPDLTIRNTKRGATPTPKVKKPQYAVRSIDEAKQPLTVDGKLNEPQWRQIPSLRLRGIGRNSQNYDTWAKIYYTKTHLVVGAYLKDEHVWGTLEGRDAKTWEQEVLEVFIDVDSDSKDYLELQITPNNVIFDANFKEMLGRGKGSAKAQIDRAKAFNVEGLEHAVHIDGTLNNDKDKDKSWTVELKIPFKSIPGLKAPPKGASNWAVNLYRFDRPAKGKRFAYAWSTQANRSFHEVSKYGRFNFMGTLPVGFQPKLIVPNNLTTKGKRLPQLKKMPTIATPLKLAPGVKLKSSKVQPKK